MLTIFLLIIVFMLGISFVSSLIEAVLLSLNPMNLRLEHHRGRSHAAWWLQLRQQVERPISAILTFNTLANTGLAAIAGALFQQLFGIEHLPWFTVILSVMVLFGTELAPKVLAVRYADRLAPHVRPALQFMMTVCRPVVWLMELLGRAIESRLHQGTTAARSQHINDIVALVQSARAENVLHDREEIILLHAATLSARRVRSAMVPGDRARVLHASASVQQMLATAGLEFRRYPVSATGRLQDATHYLRMVDLVRILQGHARMSACLHPALRVPADASLSQLLALFHEQGEKAALVHAKDGSLVGWITLDDVTDVLLGTQKTDDAWQEAA